MTTITDLIARLEEIAEEYPDAEVLLATQPNWPLRFGIAGVATSAEIDDQDGDMARHGSAEPLEQPVVVYIVEGSSDRDEPHAPLAAWEAAWI